MNGIQEREKGGMIMEKEDSKQGKEGGSIDMRERTAAISRDCQDV